MKNGISIAIYSLIISSVRVSQRREYPRRNKPLLKPGDRLLWLKSPPARKECGARKTVLSETGEVDIEPVVDASTDGYARKIAEEFV